MVTGTSKAVRVMQGGKTEGKIKMVSPVKKNDRSRMKGPPPEVELIEH